MLRHEVNSRGASSSFEKKSTKETLSRSLGLGMWKCWEMGPRVFQRSLNKSQCNIKQNFQKKKKIDTLSSIVRSWILNIWGRLASIIRCWISNVLTFIIRGWISKVQRQLLSIFGGLIQTLEGSMNLFEYFARLVSRNSLLKWVIFQICLFKIFKTLGFWLIHFHYYENFHTF